MTTSSNSIDFVNGFKFQHHNRNQQHKLPLHANFQPPTSVCNQNIGHFMFSLSSRTMTSLNSTSFAGWYKFRYNNQNYHHKLPLPTKLQLHTLFHYQDISLRKPKVFVSQILRHYHDERYPGSEVPELKKPSAGRASEASEVGPLAEWNQNLVPMSCHNLIKVAPAHGQYNRKRLVGLITHQNNKYGSRITVL